MEVDLNGESESVEKPSIEPFKSLGYQHQNYFLFYRMKLHFWRLS